MKFNFFLALFLICSLSGFSQLSISIQDPLQLTQLREGREISVQLKIVGNKQLAPFRFEIIQGKQIGMSIDSTGLFTWTPPFSAVDRIEQKRIFQLLIEAKSDSGEVVSRNLDLAISHTNRPPVISELKPFYIKYNTSNTYSIDLNLVYDPDNDPIVIIPSLASLPEGVKITSQGEVTWSPSVTQFNGLKKKEISIDFYVEDQPAKTQSKGSVRLVATQLDLPPVVTTVPKTDAYKIRENETLSIRFYLSDPNGDDDIDTFDFLSNNPNVPKQALIQNTPNQYEFVWQPGYDFVKDPRDSSSFYIDFFVLDKTQNREVQRIKINVLNTVNEVETDNKLYDLYRATLVRGWELNEQLKEKEDELKKAYNRAKKGKKNRSVINASLGATTGLSSIIAKNDVNTQRAISTVGGTTVLTIGTLEATEVIGRSMKDLVDRLNYVIEKKNEIQTKGDIFARDFSLKSTRRNSEFLRKIDDYMNAMNLKGLVALELDSSWEAKRKPTDDNIKRVFKDFNPNK